MSSERRRRELREEARIREEEAQAEAWRVSQLSFYEKVMECEDIHDIKALLMELDERITALDPSVL